MPLKTWAYLAACHAQVGSLDGAERCVVETLARKSDFSAHFVDKEPCKNLAELSLLLDGLRKAGLPE
jgi:hypothetical protein